MKKLGENVEYSRKRRKRQAGEYVKFNHLQYHLRIKVFRPVVMALLPAVEQLRVWVALYIHRRWFTSHCDRAPASACIISLVPRTLPLSRCEQLPIRHFFSTHAIGRFKDLFRVAQVTGFHSGVHTAQQLSYDSWLQHSRTTIITETVRVPSLLENESHLFFISSLPMASQGVRRSVWSLGNKQNPLNPQAPSSPFWYAEPLLGR